jgi:hypothetical protein
MTLQVMPVAAVAGPQAPASDRSARRWRGTIGGDLRDMPVP